MRVLWVTISKICGQFWHSFFKFTFKISSLLSHWDKVKKNFCVHSDISLHQRIEAMKIYNGNKSLIKIRTKPNIILNEIIWYDFRWARYSQDGGYQGLLQQIWPRGASLQISQLLLCYHAWHVPSKSLAFSFFDVFV